MTARSVAWTLLAWVVALLAWAAAGPARAHGGPPLRIVLARTADPATYVPVPADAAADVRWVDWPEDCRVEDDPERIACARPLAGRLLDARRAPTAREIVVVVSGRGGPTLAAVLVPGAPAAPLAPVEGDAASAPNSGFFAAGLRHILGGWDHLLFVALLAFGAANARRLVADVSGFTAGHAASLSWAVLARVAPNPAVEVWIALSIVVLARDVLRTGRPATGRWWQAALFGLVHGLGFAGALADLRLPEQARALALLEFNLGIEAGQLAFVVPLYAGLVLLRRRPAAHAAGRLLVAYGAGTVAFAAALLRLPALLAP